METKCMNIWVDAWDKQALSPRLQGFIPRSSPKHDDDDAWEGQSHGEWLADEISPADK